MGSSSGGCNINNESEGDICEKISKIVKDCDSSAVPIVDVVNETEHCSVVEDVSISKDLKYSDEIDDLLEEQMVLNKIKKMQNYRKSLAHYKDPELEKIDHRIIPKIKGDDKNDTIISRFADEEDDDDDDDCDNADNDSLLDCFMASDTKQFFERHSTRENLQKVSKALTLNVLMQSELTTLESFLTNRLKENRKEQIEAKAKVNKLKMMTKIKSRKRPRKFCWYTVFGRPYFKDEQKYPCPKNADCKKMKLNNQLLSINLFPSRSWKVKEKLHLEEAVRKVLAKESYHPFYEKELELKQELKTVTNGTVGKKKEIKSELQNLNNQIERIKKKSLKELFSDCVPSREFDWLRVSAKDVPRHTPDECKRMWHLYVKPTINKKRFSKEEDSSLIKLVEKFGEQNWDIIARQLQTSRTEFLCFVNYQKRLSKGSNRFGKWKEEEDERLRCIIEEYKVGNFIPWPKIAYYFEGRSLPQLYCRWSNSLNPKLKKGRFTRNEDKLIIDYVRKYGENFQKISKLLGGCRTSTQIRERYLRKKTGVCQNIGRWSLEEDELLLSLVKKYGVAHWSVISKQFITRTRTQIRQRYSAIANFLTKYSDLGIKDIHRGPKAKSQFLIPVSIVEIEAASQDQENKMLSELIKENKVKKNLLRNHNKSLLNFKKGRKQIVRRSRVDLKLISYFTDIFSHDRLKLQTHCVKPDIDKAANALKILCRYLKTSLILSSNELDKSIKKLPYMLKQVILEMAKDKSGCKSFDANTVGAITQSITDASSRNNAIDNDSDHPLIDCLPIDPKETLVSETYYLLSEPSEETELCNYINVGVKLKNSNFIPHFLPPNIITMIGCRSIILIKGTIAKSLSHGLSKKTMYFSPNESELMKEKKLKVFNGYFSEDESRLIENDEMEKGADVNHDKVQSLPCIDLEPSMPSTSHNENILTNPLPSLLPNSTYSVNLKPSIPYLVDEDVSSTNSSLPSASNDSIPRIFSQPSLPISTEIRAVECLDNGENDVNLESLKQEDPCVMDVRLSKQEAIDLWKERLMAIFGWPIVLANQPPNVCNYEIDEEEETPEYAANTERFNRCRANENCSTDVKSTEKSKSKSGGKDDVQERSLLMDVKNRHKRYKRIRNFVFLENSGENPDSVTDGSNKVGDECFTTNMATSSSVSKKILAKNEKDLDENTEIQQYRFLQKNIKNAKKLQLNISEENKLLLNSETPETENLEDKRVRRRSSRIKCTPKNLADSYQSF